MDKKLNKIKKLNNDMRKALDDPATAAKMKKMEKGNQAVQGELVELQKQKQKLETKLQTKKRMLATKVGEIGTMQVELGELKVEFDEITAAGAGAGFDNDALEKYGL